ncbi:YihY/virulence factor BrkB family protein [soil metagenome]
MGRTMARSLPSLASLRVWFQVEARLYWADVKVLARRSVSEFVDDHCTQIAASISYYVFFSVFPLSIFLITIFGQVLRNESVRDRVIEGLMEVVPLAPVEGREQLEEILSGVATDISLLGLLSIVGLLWSASAMMAALRRALNIAWDTNHRRTAVRGKLLDIFMVLMVGLLVGLSIAATTVRPYVQDEITAVSDELSLIGSLLRAGMWLLTFVIPIVVSFLIFAALFRFVPAVKTSFDEIWPGALFAAIAFEMAKVGFTFYLRNFGNYNAIYGSLGAVIVFMLFIFLAANVLLMGAEVASEWPRVRAGHYDRGMPARESGPEIPFKERIRMLLRQAILGTGEDLEHVDDAEIEDRNRRRRAEAYRKEDG